MEKIWFDPNEDLPRNRSFEFNLESCVHEAKVNKNGRIHTIQDVDMHKHLDTAEDLEMDGITEGSGTHTIMVYLAKSLSLQKLAHAIYTEIFFDFKN